MWYEFENRLTPSKTYLFRFIIDFFLYFVKKRQKLPTLGKSMKKINDFFILSISQKHL